MKKLNDYFEAKWLILAGALTAIVIVLTHIPQALAPSEFQGGGLAHRTGRIGACADGRALRCVRERGRSAG